MITFTTKLETIKSYLVMRLPQDASDQLPSRGQTLVRGIINDTKILTPLEPDGYGGHWLEISDATIEDGDTFKAGDSVTVNIEPAKDWPEPVIPKDLKSALDNNAEAYATWVKATPMAHWEWLRWLNSTNNPQTRAKRVEVSCSKLTRGMRRPCCFNRSMCCVADVSSNGKLLAP